MRSIFRLLGISNDFERMFFSKEFNDLTGKSRRSIIALSIILALTISALGYAVGGIKYLKKRMDNPFTNWVNLPIKNSYKKRIPMLEDHFDLQANRDSFFLDNITKYKIDGRNYINVEDNQDYYLKTRSVGKDEDILREILKPENVVFGKSLSKSDEIDIPLCGMIVKQQSLAEYLGYSVDKPLDRLALISSEFIFFPEVIAVVKELPNLSHVMYTSHFSNLLNTSFDKTGFVQMNPVNRITFVGKLPENHDKKITDKQIKDILGIDVSDIEYDKVYLNEDNALDQITITLFDFLKFEEIKALVPKFDKAGILKNARARYKSECNVGDFSDLENPHYLAFNFKKLDNVRAFNDFLKNDPRFLMEISMDQIESKENFALVSRLTGLIAIILLAFSILSIVFYINSLLTTHLEGIKNNLGTLKAFGLNNSFLISVYIKIIVIFLLIAIVLAFCVSFLIKGLELTFTQIPVIDLFDYRIFVTMLVVILISSWITYNSIKRILLKTPGDLIYNR